MRHKFSSFAFRDKILIKVVVKVSYSFQGAAKVKETTLANLFAIRRNIFNKC